MLRRMVRYHPVSYTHLDVYKRQAQVMIIAGCNNGGTVPLPNWRLNLCFAAKWEERMEMLYPGLTRPVLCGYRFYNQDVSPGALLIEIGGHANTVQQAVRAGQYAAKALAALFLSLIHIWIGSVRWLNSRPCCSH